MCSVRFRHVFLQQCFYKKLLLIHWCKHCNNVLELYDPFNQAGIKPSSLGKPLVSCYGPPECPGHHFGATKFSASPCSFPSAALWGCGVCRELPRLLWQRMHGVTELGWDLLMGSSELLGGADPVTLQPRHQRSSCIPGRAATSRCYNSTNVTLWALCCRGFIILVKHWGCFLVLKPQVSNSTVNFCHLLVTQRSELCSRGKTAEPILDNFAESGKTARIGTCPCIARKYCYALESAFHILLSLPLQFRFSWFVSRCRFAIVKFIYSSRSQMVIPGASRSVVVPEAPVNQLWNLSCIPSASS